MSMIGNYLKLSSEQLATLARDPSAVEEFAYPSDGDVPADAMDIDKSWHLVHYLLTGESWGGEAPLKDAVLGGRELAGTDTGYGPYRYLTAADVRATSRALTDLTADALWARFDVERVNTAQIYPTPWAGDDGDRDYVTSNYEALRKYFFEAVVSGQGMLLYLG